jgi:phosphoribosylamine---glycine ligase
VRILVVGGGGREHAMAWRLGQNVTVDRLYAAPGNAGIAREATCVPIAADDVPSIVDLVERESIDLTVVGPEVPLAAGIVDELELLGGRVFGPSRDAARIEISKAWTKDLCDRYGIPAARSGTFAGVADAETFLDEVGPPYVVKVDGLAAGKGVTVTERREEAVAAIEAALVDRVFGDAGDRVIVEEYLEGREVSAFAVTDGREILPLALARDYKRVNDGDAGPNTGGMGAYSPVDDVDEHTERRIYDEIISWAVRAMEAEGVRYRGVLYAGCMLTAEGPKLLEFNCRFGDPEAQAIIPRLQTDLGEMFLACIEGNLSNYKVNWRPEVSVTVVATSGGYPGPYATGLEVVGLRDAEDVDDTFVFHSGTAEVDGRVVTSGGRVLSVGALGDSLADARATAYRALECISFDGMHYRSDIAGEGTE